MPVEVTTFTFTPLKENFSVNNCSGKYLKHGQCRKVSECGKK